MRPGSKSSRGWRIGRQRSSLSCCTGSFVSLALGYSPAFIATGVRSPSELRRGSQSDQPLYASSRREQLDLMSTGVSIDHAKARIKLEIQRLRERLVLPDRIELSTSPLPMECSTTELRQRTPDEKKPRTYRVRESAKKPLKGARSFAIRPWAAQAWSGPVSAEQIRRRLSWPACISPVPGRSGRSFAYSAPARP